MQSPWSPIRISRWLSLICWCIYYRFDCHDMFNVVWLLVISWTHWLAQTLHPAPIQHDYNNLHLSMYSYYFYYQVQIWYYLLQKKMQQRPAKKTRNLTCLTFPPAQFRNKCCLSMGLPRVLDKMLTHDIQSIANHHHQEPSRPCGLCTSKRINYLFPHAGVWRCMNTNAKWSYLIRINKEWF